jgi:hypothetical protein
MIVVLGVIYMGAFAGNLNIKGHSQVLEGTMIDTGSEEIVIITPGSGPTDRDGNSPLLQGKNDSLRMLAKALEGRGISSYRYDKQNWSAEITFDDFIFDLVEGIRFFKAMGYEKIYLAGHSQGSLVAMAASNREPVDGVISLSGAGRSIDKILADQLKVKSIKPYLDHAGQGDLFEEESQIIQILFRKDTLDFLKSWIAYDPVKEIEKLNVPILLVQGTADSQVSELELRLLSSTKPEAKVLLIETMNHVLKLVTNQEEDVDSYSSPDYQISDIMIKEMADFVLK